MNRFDLEITWDLTFVELNKLEGYPIGGFVAIFGSNGGNSDVYVLNTILKDDVYTISFKYPESIIYGFNSMYLYYIDYAKDPSFNPYNLYATGDTITPEIELLRAEHLAGVLTWTPINSMDDSAPDFNLFTVNDVIKMAIRIPDGDTWKNMPIKCSFSPLYQKGSVDFNHYSGYHLGQLPYSKLKDDDKLISLNGSIGEIKTKMTNISKQDLNGILHLGTSGVVSL